MITKNEARKKTQIKVLSHPLEYRGTERRTCDGRSTDGRAALLLWDRKNINIEGWEGFIFSRGVLRCKNRRWTAKRILELTGQKQQLYPILKNLFY